MATIANPDIATPTAPSITLEKVSKFFGRFPALLEVDANFYSASVTALLGSNGSGKSTLLRLLGRLSQPTHGRVIVPSVSSPGYMAHASLLYDEMSGMENIQYFAALYGISSPEHCSSAMAAVGLDPALPRLVRDYSQGMRQRLSLVRAVIHSPKVLLLDEPFSNVDADSAARMLALLTRMKQDGNTIIVATHQPELLGKIADRSLTLTAGRIAESAHPQGVSH